MHNGKHKKFRFIIGDMDITIEIKSVGEIASRSAMLDLYKKAKVSRKEFLMIRKKGQGGQ